MLHTAFAALGATAPGPCAAPTCSRSSACWPDRPASPAKFPLLGSASPDLVIGSSESLAGRIAYRELRGFSLDEVGADLGDRLWLRGGSPRAFLAESDAASAEWRRDFVRTFLERDLAQLGVRIPAETLRRFWMMVAHSHGQVWSGAELARSFGVSDTTVRRYLDVLTAALVLRQLSPWHEHRQAAGESAEGVRQ